ncbi:MAG: gamma-glutamylcyclotransferase [Pseudomonadota bacterium]|nr:gamma-glutamylcyclotransferase [Pseudomonadota bacterium]
MTFPADTLDLNRAMNHFAGHDRLWLFDYGSLIYKVDFPFLERRPARVRNWGRRFWQGSHDHRGTPEQPGRVVTLVHSPGAVCEGMAYLITPGEFKHLDYREKNGYLRWVTDIHFTGDESCPGVVYVADEHNAAFLGPAPEREIAEHIARSAGPSGSNAEYLLQLAEALRALGEHDEHVFAIERYLRSLPDSAP